MPHRIRALNRLRLLDRVLESPLWQLARRLGHGVIERGQLRSRCATFLEFGEEETAALEGAITDGPVSVAARDAATPLDATFQRPFVASFEDVLLARKSATPYLHGRDVILEGTSPLYREVISHLAEHAKISERWASSFRRCKQVDVAVSLVGRWSKNYWHWAADFLTRLEGLKHWERETGRQASLVVDADAHPWQRESLARLGFGAERFLPWTGAPLRVNHFLVPSIRRDFDGSHFGIPAPGAFRVLVEIIRKGLGIRTGGTRRLYVSRTATTSRRVVNEAELLPVLKKWKFEIMDPGVLPYSEQVRAFAGAEAVVGAHGAALTNLLYGMAPVVIELFGPVCPRCYSVAARGLGFRYGFLCSEAPPWDFRGWDADMHVDADRLDAFFGQMLG